MAYYKDINLDFETNNSGDIKADENDNAVINSIENILATLQGSRRMLPQFSEGLHSLLFDPIDEITAGYISDIIERSIERWEDRVVIEKIDVIPIEDENRYELVLKLNVVNLGEMTYTKNILKY